MLPSFLTYCKEFGALCLVTIVLFRVATYWIRVPLDWLAYRWMRRIGEL